MPVKNRDEITNYLKLFCKGNSLLETYLHGALYNVLLCDPRYLRTEDPKLPLVKTFVGNEQLDSEIVIIKDWIEALIYFQSDYLDNRDPETNIPTIFTNICGIEHAKRIIRDTSEDVPTRLFPDEKKRDVDTIKYFGKKQHRCVELITVQSFFSESDALKIDIGECEYDTKKAGYARYISLRDQCNIPVALLEIACKGQTQTLIRVYGENSNPINEYNRPEIETLIQDLNLKIAETCNFTPGKPVLRLPEPNEP